MKCVQLSDASGPVETARGTTAIFPNWGCTVRIASISGASSSSSVVKRYKSSGSEEPSGIRVADLRKSLKKGCPQASIALCLRSGTYDSKLLTRSRVSGDIVGRKMLLHG